MKTVKYLGGVHNLKVVTDGEDGPILEDDVYNGFDHDKGKDGAFTLFAGDATEVGDRCAASLETKYPGCFEIDGVKSSKPKKSRRAKVADEGDGNDDGRRPRDRGAAGAAAGAPRPTDR